MFKTHFIMTLRSSLKRRKPSMASVMGATARMCVAILIGWWLCDEGGCDQYDWLAAAFQPHLIDEDIRMGFRQLLDLLNYLGDKYNFNLEQVVLADWLLGRLVSDWVESCFRGRLQLQSLS